MDSELAYGANFRCVLHHLSNLTRLKGSWSQLGPKTCPKQQKVKLNRACVPRGLVATKYIFNFDLGPKRSWVWARPLRPARAGLCEVAVAGGSWEVAAAPGPEPSMAQSMFLGF